MIVLKFMCIIGMKILYLQLVIILHSFISPTSPSTMCTDTMVNLQKPLIYQEIQVRVAFSCYVTSICTDSYKSYNVTFTFIFTLYFTTITS